MKLPASRLVLRTIMVAMVLIQVLLPAKGLYVAYTTGEAQKFSWYMFSRLEPDAPAINVAPASGDPGDD